MVFDAQFYHENIASQADSFFGLVIVDREKQTPFHGFMTGRVSPFNLKCRTSDYLKKGGLEKAKYQLHLIHPTDKVLGHDFDAVFCNLENTQKVAGTTGDHRNMLIRDITGEMICVVSNVFEPRTTPIPDSPHDNWAIPTEHEDKFDTVKYTHHALILPVFDDSKSVAPLDINRALNGALVKVQGYDTFQAKAERIKILKHSATMLKHHLSDVDEGQPAHKKQEVGSSQG
ncbi:hypothetical protein BDR07DRAFT_1373462 [Suillus spraguei]|nr:hypothetical protein BDR07DRAFT_1373462 [Suillus spraguei]